MAAKNFLSRMLPEGGVRNVAILTGGTSVAQAISILAAPLLTRLYTPDDFGLLAIYSGFLAILSLISAFRYELAVPLPKEDYVAAVLVALSLVCIAIVSGFSAIILLLFGEIITHKLNAQSLNSYLWLLPVSILLTGAYQVFSYWNLRSKHFTILAQTKIIQSLSATSVQLLGFGLGPVALILGQVASQAAGFARLAKSAFQYRDRSFKKISFTEILVQAGRYKRFPLYTAWAGLFNVLGTQLPPILFAALFTPAVAGLYALANRVLSMPMLLVGQSIGQVYFSEAAESRRVGRIGDLVSKVHDKLAQLAMPPSLFLLFVAPELFSFIFGPEWKQAGVFTQFLIPMLYFQFIVSPISQTLLVMERQEVGTILQGVMLLLRFFSLAIGAWRGDVLLTVGLFSIASSIGYILFLISTMYITDLAFAAIMRPTVTAFVWSIIAVSPIILGVVLQMKNHNWNLLLILVSFAFVSLRCCTIVFGDKLFKRPKIIH
ncbi:oligosaccharide flippase family protein [Thermodesulfobacteriota bacterium]